MMDYDLELDKVILRIKEKGLKRVCIQLPEGLKPRAKEITDSIRKQTGAEVLIWAGSCFGSCDYPDLSSLEVELLVQWGHSG